MLLLYDEEDKPIGTGRLLPDGHMGRMAVLNRARNCGVGAAILRTLMEQAKLRGHTQLCSSMHRRLLKVSICVKVSNAKVRSFSKRH